MLIRQNKLFSSLYVLGTGLAIAMTMIIAIVYYIKIAYLSEVTVRDDADEGEHERKEIHM